MSDRLNLTVNVDIQAAETKTPFVSILAYSGGAMQLPGWPKMVIDLAGLDTSSQVPILADHKNDLSGIVGHGIASVRDGKLFIEGQLLRESEATQTIISHAKNGFEFQASVGVQPTERRHIDAGETVHVNNRTITAPAGGLLLIEAGVLRETSVVAIGADQNSSVSIAAKSKGANAMADITTTPETTTTNNSARISATWKSATWFEDSGPKERAESAMLAAHAGTINFADFERTLLREQVADAKLAVIMAERPKAPGIRSSSRGDGGTGNVLEAMILCHSGHDELAGKTLGDQATQTARSRPAGHILDIIKASF